MPSSNILPTIPDLSAITANKETIMPVLNRAEQEQYALQEQFNNAEVLRNKTLALAEAKKNRLQQEGKLASSATPYIDAYNGLLSVLEQKRKEQESTVVSPEYRAITTPITNAISTGLDIVTSPVEGTTRFINRKVNEMHARNEGVPLDDPDKMDVIFNYFKLPTKIQDNYKQQLEEIGITDKELQAYYKYRAKQKALNYTIEHIKNKASDFKALFSDNSNDVELENKINNDLKPIVDEWSKGNYVNSITEFTKQLVNNFLENPAYAGRKAIEALPYTIAFAKSALGASAALFLKMYEIALYQYESKYGTADDETSVRLAASTALNLAVETASDKILLSRNAVVPQALSKVSKYLPKDIQQGISNTAKTIVNVDKNTKNIARGTAKIIEGVGSEATEGAIQAGLEQSNKEKDTKAAIDTLLNPNKEQLQERFYSGMQGGIVGGTTAGGRLLLSTGVNSTIKASTRLKDHTVIDEHIQRTVNNLQEQVDDRKYTDLGNIPAPKESDPISSIKDLTDYIANSKASIEDKKKAIQKHSEVIKSAEKLLNEASDTNKDTIQETLDNYRTTVGNFELNSSKSEINTPTKIEGNKVKAKELLDKYQILLSSLDPKNQEHNASKQVIERRISKLQNVDKDKELISSVVPYNKLVNKLFNNEDTKKENNSNTNNTSTNNNTNSGNENTSKLDTIKLSKQGELSVDINKVKQAITDIHKLLESGSKEDVNKANDLANSIKQDAINMEVITTAASNRTKKSNEYKVYAEVANQAYKAYRKARDKYKALNTTEDTSNAITTKTGKVVKLKSGSIDVDKFTTVVNVLDSDSKLYDSLSKEDKAVIDKLYKQTTGKEYKPKKTVNKTADQVHDEVINSTTASYTGLQEYKRQLLKALQDEDVKTATFALSKIKLLTSGAEAKIKAIKKGLAKIQKGTKQRTIFVSGFHKGVTKEWAIHNTDKGIASANRMLDTIQKEADLGNLILNSIKEHSKIKNDIQEPVKNNIVESNNKDTTNKIQKIDLQVRERPDKDKAKFKYSKATKYIGFGEGSTGYYKQQIESTNMPVNNEEYTKDDVVFVSINGKGKLTTSNLNKTIRLVQKALDAGAIVLTDSEEYLNNSNYNTGEKALAEALLRTNKYYRVTAKQNNKVGIWRKKTESNNKTEEEIKIVKPNQVFVFGSNTAGIHGKGAAKTAKDKYGAVKGKGEGEYGKSYALPTKDSNLKTLPLKEIKKNILKFIVHATKNPDKEYLVTPIGTGLAGYTHEEIAPLFKDAVDVDNIILPEVWKDLANKRNKLKKEQPTNTTTNKEAKNKEVTKNKTNTEGRKIIAARGIKPEQIKKLEDITTKSNTTNLLNTIVSSIKDCM